MRYSSEGSTHSLVHFTHHSPDLLGQPTLMMETLEDHLSRGSYSLDVLNEAAQKGTKDRGVNERKMNNHRQRAPSNRNDDSDHRAENNLTPTKNLTKVDERVNRLKRRGKYQFV